MEWLKIYAEEQETSVSNLINDMIIDFIMQREHKGIEDFNSREEYKSYLINIVRKLPLNKYD